MLSSEYSLEQQLQNCLKPYQRAGAVLNLRQIQGLFFALTCSPQPVAPEDWFELIWLVDEPRFADDKDAQQLLGLLTALSQHIGYNATQGKYLPFAPDFSARWQADLSDWCDGFLMGHQYLDEIWEIALDDLNDGMIDDQVNASLDLASMLAEWDAAGVWSMAEGEELNEADLPAVYSRFRQLLASYYLVHLMWYHGTGYGQWDVEKVFEELEAPPYDELCPCGSGRIFRRCCLH